MWPHRHSWTPLVQVKERLERELLRVVTKATGTLWESTLDSHSIQVCHQGTHGFSTARLSDGLDAPQAPRIRQSSVLQGSPRDGDGLNSSVKDTFLGASPQGLWQAMGTAPFLGTSPTGLATGLTQSSTAQFLSVPSDRPAAQASRSAPPPVLGAAADAGPGKRTIYFTTALSKEFREVKTDQIGAMPAAMSAGRGALPPVVYAYPVPRSRLRDFDNTLAFCRTLGAAEAELGVAFPRAGVRQMCREAVLKCYEVGRQQATLPCRGITALHVLPLFVYTYVMDPAATAPQVSSCVNQALQGEAEEAGRQRQISAGVSSGSRAFRFWLPLIWQLQCVLDSLPPVNQSLALYRGVPKYLFAAQEADPKGEGSKSRLAAGHIYDVGQLYCFPSFLSCTRAEDVARKVALNASVSAKQEGTVVTIKGKVNSCAKVLCGCGVVWCTGLCCVVLCHVASYGAALCCVAYRVVGYVVLCCVVLCCVVLCCGVLWCVVVWCGVVWCGVVWCGVVWCGVVWCVVLCCVVLCCVVLCCVVLCCVVLCCVVLCCVVLCCVVLCCVVLCCVDTAQHHNRVVVRCIVPCRDVLCIPLDHRP